MNNKITVKNSLKTMGELIRKSNGKFWSIVVLILLPVLIINCSTFYLAYEGVTLNYDAFNGIDWDTIALRGEEGIKQFQAAFYNFIPSVSAETSTNEMVLQAIGSILLIMLDALLIVLGVSVFFEKQIDNTGTFKMAAKKLLSVLFISIITSWLYYEIQNLVFSGVLTMALGLSIGNTIMLASFVITVAFVFLIATFFACFVTLIADYALIASVSSRTRLFMSIGYAREVLRKRILKQMWHILPFVILGVIIPNALMSIGVVCMSNAVLGVSLAGISTVMQVVVLSLLWFYLVPDFFTLEKESGIQAKLRAMFEEAVKMQAEDFIKRAGEKKENSDNAASDNEKDKVEEEHSQAGAVKNSDSVSAADSDTDADSCESENSEKETKE